MNVLRVLCSSVQGLRRQLGPADSLGHIRLFVSRRRSFIKTTTVPVIRQFILSKTIPKNQDPSYKTDLDPWDYIVKSCIKAKFRRIDLVIHSHSRERKTLSYSRRNTVSLCIQDILIIIPLKGECQPMFVTQPNLLITPHN